MHKYKSTLNIEWTKLKLKIKHWNALVVALCGVFQLYLKQQIPSLLYCWKLEDVSKCTVSLIHHPEIKGSKAKALSGDLRP